MPKELVTSADIADMAGVSRQAVSNWKYRYEDFPKPVDTFRNYFTLYLREEVVDWLENRAKQ